MLPVAVMEERDLVTVLLEFFIDTRAAHLMAREALVDIIFLGSSRFGVYLANEWLGVVAQTSHGCCEL